MQALNEQKHWTDTTTHAHSRWQAQPTRCRSPSQHVTHGRLGHTIGSYVHPHPNKTRNKTKQREYTAAAMATYTCARAAMNVLCSAPTIRVSNSNGVSLTTLGYARCRTYEATKHAHKVSIAQRWSEAGKLSIVQAFFFYMLTFAFIRESSRRAGLARGGTAREPRQWRTNGSISARRTTKGASASSSSSSSSMAVAVSLGASAGLSAVCAMALLLSLAPCFYRMCRASWRCAHAHVCVWLRCACVRACVHAYVCE